MISIVINNLRPVTPHRFIFICLKEHVYQYGLDNYLKKWAPECQILTVSDVTEGAACTVLTAKELIDNDSPLMIANCDQLVNIDINVYLSAMEYEGFDGFIMTMRANHPKWSYIRFDNNHKIAEVVEKKVVSNEATVGIYNFRYGRQFVASAQEMIEQGARVNNEYYVAPCYNYMLAARYKIGYYDIGSDRDGMHGIGVPDDLESFETINLERMPCLNNLFIRDVPTDIPHPLTAKSEIMLE